jgi:hypothetical protein
MMRVGKKYDHCRVRNWTDQKAEREAIIREADLGHQLTKLNKVVSRGYIPGKRAVIVLVDDGVSCRPCQIEVSRTVHHGIEADGIHGFGIVDLTLYAALYPSLWLMLPEYR